MFATAKDIVTPSISMTMTGFGSVYGNPFQNIHDDLYVRTLVLKDDSNTIILISLDLLFHDDSLTESVRAYAKDKYKVLGDHLLITYTHTHYGPTVKGYDIIFHREEYENFLYDRIVQSIDRAFLNFHEGTMEYSSVEGEWNMSRRLMVDGKMEFTPNPDGDRDKSIYLLRLKDLEGKIRGMVMNFACHPSNLNAYRSLSSEYPGRLCHLVEANNYGCTALFFQGAGADTKLKMGAKSSKFHQISHAECNEVASSMALRIQETLLSGTWEKIVPKLSGKMFQIEMPLDVYPLSFFEGELESLRGDSKERFHKSMVDPDRYGGPHLRWGRVQYIVDNYSHMPDYMMLNCGVIRLGEGYYIFTVGGEPSFDVKRVLKSVVPEDTMLFFGYNDAIAYVPTDKLLDEGGYEAGDRSVTEYRMKGKFKKGMDGRFCQSFKEALDEINGC